jgi:hypothetical protein
MTVTLVKKRRLYDVSEIAVQQAKELGLGGDLIKRLQRMAMRSAPFTHPEGNRRFDAFVLQVSDSTVVAINRI